MTFDFQTVGLLFGAIWLIILTFFVWKSHAHYKYIAQGTKDPTATAILGNLAKGQEGLKKDLETLFKRVGILEEGSLQHIQKIGLVRFNPFKDTGGEQSFILALVDAKNSGVVISGLYSRAGTRWYAKKVHNGKGVDHELSDEEIKAIEIAK